MKAIIFVFVIMLIYNYLFGKFLVWMNQASFEVTNDNATKTLPLNAFICVAATIFVSATTDNVYNYDLLASFFFGSFIGIILGLRR